jgi:hypothetical protein
LQGTAGAGSTAEQTTRSGAVFKELGRHISQSELEEVKLAPEE